MDGLEWKRSKFSSFTQKLMKKMEKIAATKSDCLIADNIGIKNYLQEKYKIESHFIPYSSEIFNLPNAEYLKPYNLKPYEYLLVIARMEPENNIEMMIEGYIESKSEVPLFLIGNINNKYCQFLKGKYDKFKDKVVFQNALYGKEVIDNLRYYSKYYLHGHSVGGTNPSLLEAMGAGSIIIGHDNEFNRSVLKDTGFFFSSTNELSNLLQNLNLTDSDRLSLIYKNLDIIKKYYNQDYIVEEYEKLFATIIEGNKKSYF